MSIYDVGEAIFSGQFDLNDPNIREDVVGIIQALMENEEDDSD